LTKDGVSIINLEKEGHFRIFDSYLQDNLITDINSFITSHVLFSFSAIGLVELQELFKKLYNLSKIVHNIQYQPPQYHKSRDEKESLDEGSTFAAAVSDVKN